MKTLAVRRLFPLLLVLSPVLLAPWARAAEPPKESWLGIYFNGRKIGYTTLRTERAIFRGKPALKIVSTGRVRIEILGNKVEQETDSVLYADTRYRPLHQVHKIASNGSVVSIRADYRPGKILCEVASGGGPSKKVIPVPKGANLVGDSTFMTQGQRLAIGQKATLYYLNPLTIALDRLEITVAAKDQVTLDGKSYEAFRITATSMIGKITSWETGTGEMLKGEMPLGMAMFSEPKATALNMSSTMPAFTVTGTAVGTESAYVPPTDFALATAITTDRPIPHPRKVRSLRLRVTGLEEDLIILSDKRQRGEVEEGPEKAYSVHVTADKFDPARSATLPIKEPSVQPYLKSAPYLETDNPDIRRTARQLRGKEKNAYRVAVRICQWVHAQMKPDYTIGVPRSCTDVYRRRRGVCRDYATLFAGLARAAGLPTRVVGGIVYAEGKFFYHAWAESWVGEWVAFDPTQGPDFVDATHVKFAQGDVTDMFDVARIIGRIKIQVVSVE